MHYRQSQQAIATGNRNRQSHRQSQPAIAPAIATGNRKAIAPAIAPAIAAGNRKQFDNLPFSRVQRPGNV
jgi:hypothetical protein